MINAAASVRFMTAKIKLGALLFRPKYEKPPESLITGRWSVCIAIMENRKPRILHITSISDEFVVNNRISFDSSDRLYFSVSSWFTANLFHIP